MNSAARFSFSPFPPGVTASAQLDVRAGPSDGTHQRRRSLLVAEENRFTAGVAQCASRGHATPCSVCIAAASCPAALLAFVYMNRLKDFLGEFREPDRPDDYF